MFRIFPTLFFIAGLLCAPAVSAVVVSGLYEAEVAVSDQSQANHKKALIRAMQEMLVKLTGDRSVKGRPIAEFMAGKIESYVQQYEYRNRPVFTQDQLSLEEELSLWVSFNQQTVDQALRDYNVQVWGAVRPSTLVWLGVKDAGDRRLLGLEDPSGYTAAIDAFAQSRGIALTYPLLDATDTGAVNVTDLWGGTNQPVINASKRYPADAILSGHFEQVSGKAWQGRFSAVIDGRTITHNAKAADSNALLRDAINWLADALADHYSQPATATTASGGDGVDIEINGIQNFDQYSEVLKHLSALNSVVSVKVKTVRPDNVLFTLQTTGGDVAVRRAIELGRLLQSNGVGSNSYRLISQAR